MSNIQDLLKAKIAAKEAALKASVDTFVPNTPALKKAAIAAIQSNPTFQASLAASLAAMDNKKAAMVKMSLAQKLAAKKAEEATKELQEEAPELPKALQEEIVPEAQIKEFILPKPVSLAQALAISASIPKAPEVPKPINAPVPVISTEQGFMSLQDLHVEIARLYKLLTKIKSQAIQTKVHKLEEKLIELETQIDLEREAMASEIATVNKEVHLVLPHKEEYVHTATPTAVPDSSYKGAFSLSIELNERQLMAKDMALSGKSFCLIGPAGTGKTTAQRSVAGALLKSGMLKTCSFKKQGSKDRVEGPSFVAVAFTRRASANLARAIHKDPELEVALRHNIMTIHALLEFEPVIFFDETKGRESMRFEPKRDAQNPLNITHLVIEESSMLGLDLTEQLFDALPSGVQIVYIGDINQLPPVFGASILNYALVQLPVIELVEVYRNGGIILENAHNILAGKKLVEGESIDKDTGKRSKFTIVRGKSDVQVGQERMAHTLGLLFKRWEEEGDYIPDEDMILSPFNKQALGTDNMNKWVAQFLGEKRQAIVYEIIAGFNVVYLAVGDRVMVNKQDGYITNIRRNTDYLGKDPQLPGSDLSRFGMRVIGADTASDLDEMNDATLNYSNFNLDTIQEQDAERKQQASHAVEIVLESGETVELKSAGDFGPATFSLGYVLTVHKAQGCEFRKVFIIFHKDHNVMLSRELFYTAETRAREEICLIAKDWVIDRAIKTQRIKGNSLEEKIEYFNSGAVEMLGTVRCTK